MSKDRKSRTSGEGYGRILKYTGLFGGVQILQVVVSVLRNKCAAIFVGSAGMGINDILNRTTDMFSSLTNMGIPLSGVRAVAADKAAGDILQLRSRVATIRIWSLLTGIVGTTLCFALAGIVNSSLFAGKIPHGFLRIAAPVILFMSVYGGEAAIMKGTHSLRRLATTSAVGALLSLVSTAAIYIAYGIAGIPWALLAGSLILMLSALTATHKMFPWNGELFSARHIAAGKALLTLGVAYVAAGFAGTGAEMLVRAFISQSSLSDVGIYAAGFVICATYTRIVFVAMDADFFPRLSAQAHNTDARNAIVSKQIDVCVLLMAPMIATLLMFLPEIIRLLYSAEFTEAESVCIGAAGYLLLKAVISPIEYIPLATGDSATYFAMELIYDIVFVGSIAAGYHLLGISGTGIALTASYLVDFIVVFTVYRRRYGLRLSPATVRIFIFQGAVVAAAFATFCMGYALPQRMAGAAWIGVSALYSIKKLNLKWSNIKQWAQSRMAERRRRQ